MVYTTYIIPLIYCQLGDYMVPIPPIKGNQETPLMLWGCLGSWKVKNVSPQNKGTESALWSGEAWNVGDRVNVYHPPEK